MVETATRPSQRRFSLAHLVLVVPWVALVIDAWAPIRDNSFLWHVRAGQLQAQAGEVLTVDPFSFTMLGEPWRTQSWLAELLYGWGEQISGLGFVPPMMLVTSSVAFVTFGLIAYRFSKSVPATAVLIVLTTLLLISFLVPRPVIFSFALFGVAILAWERPAARWALPFLFWIWASVHGSFAIGLAYVGLSVVARREWRALPHVLVSGMATLATAHGIGILSMLVSFARAGDALALLTEWRRPELGSITFFPFVIGLVLILVGAFRQRVTPAHLWILVPFLLLGLGATRAVPPAWIALLPLASAGLHGLGVSAARRFGRPSALAFAVVVVFLPFLVERDPGLDEQRFPVAAAEALQDVPTFHDDRAGGYLIWANGPERLVYLDDRAELYGNRLAEFVALRSGEADWRRSFERDGIEQVLLRSDEGLLDTLRAAGWRLTYEDDDYTVLRPRADQ
jgi:hypothetical protein